MVVTTIEFDKDNVQPPVFVAGAFTDWVPQEMTAKSLNDSQNFTFSYQADIIPGKHQYKFRLGPGDWWVVDESAPTGMTVTVTIL
jgi:1,4-alpha-glucan branching enzyme